MKFNTILMTLLCVGVLFVNVRADDDEEMDGEDWVEAITSCLSMIKSLYQLSLLIGWPAAIIVSLLMGVLGIILMENCPCCRKIMDKKYQRHRIAAETGYLIWG